MSARSARSQVPDYAAMDRYGRDAPPAGRSKGKRREQAASQDGAPRAALGRLDLNQLHAGAASPSRSPEGSTGAAAESSEAQRALAHPAVLAARSADKSQHRADVATLQEVIKQQRESAPRLGTASNTQQSHSSSRDGSDDQDDVNGGAEAPARKRRRTTADESEITRAAGRFVYCTKPFLTNSELTVVFRSATSVIEEDRASDMDNLRDCIGQSIGFDKVVPATSIEFRLKMNQARSEAGNRIRSNIAAVLAVNDADLRRAGSTLRADLIQDGGLRWTMHDPDHRTGLLQSDRVTRAISAILYGPSSIHKTCAKARASHRSKGVMWGIRSIPPQLVALAVSLVTSVLRGDKEFILTGEKNLNLKLYDTVIKKLTHGSTRGPILSALNRQLIPARNEGESPDQSDAAADLDALLDEEDEYVRSDYEEDSVSGEAGSGSSGEGSEDGEED